MSHCLRFVTIVLITMTTISVIIPFRSFILSLVYSSAVSLGDISYPI